MLGEPTSARLEFLSYSIDTAGKLRSSRILFATKIDEGNFRPEAHGQARRVSEATYCSWLTLRA